LPQQARAHRGCRAIQHVDERSGSIPSLSRLPAQRFDELEVASRHLVEGNNAVRALDDGASQ
jgi:hypothetical protein